MGDGALNTRGLRRHRNLLIGGVVAIGGGIYFGPLFVLVVSFTPIGRIEWVFHCCVAVPFAVVAGGVVLIGMGLYKGLRPPYDQNDAWACHTSEQNDDYTMLDLYRRMYGHDPDEIDVIQEYRKHARDYSSW